MGRDLEIHVTASVDRWSFACVTKIQHAIRRDIDESLSLSLVEKLDGFTYPPESDGRYIVRLESGLRYFDPRRGRLDWPKIACIARWLRHSMAGETVMYGNDIDKVMVAFDDALEIVLWHLYCDRNKGFGRDQE